MPRDGNPPPPAPQPPVDRSNERSGAGLAAAIAAAVLIAAPMTARFEGLRTHPYRDRAPKHTLTVCYGDTKVAMRLYTPAECLVLLEARQRRDYAPPVARCTPSIVKNAAVFAASIDAAYNSGQGNYCRSPMAARFNARDLVGGCKAFRGWHTLPGTNVHNGLVARREAERSLCLKGAAG